MRLNIFRQFFNALKYVTAKCQDILQLIVIQALLVSRKKVSHSSRNPIWIMLLFAKNLLLQN